LKEVDDLEKEKKRQQDQNKDYKNKSKACNKKKNVKDKKRVSGNLGIRRKCRSGEEV